MKKCLVAGTLIFTRDGKRVLLIRHRKLGVWIYPGGHLEKSETPLECAIREAKEETGASFNVISTSSVDIQSSAVKTMPQPLIIMNEIVPYKMAPHQHFDIIYLGVADKMKIRKNNESTECRWVEKDKIVSLETYENVKRIIEYGFEIYRHLSKKW